MHFFLFYLFIKFEEQKHFNDSKKYFMAEGWRFLNNELELNC